MVKNAEFLGGLREVGNVNSVLECTKFLHVLSTGRKNLVIK
jgi:hypothetical protein